MNISIVTWQRWNGRKPGSVGSSVIRGDWLVNADPEFSFWKHGAQYDALIVQKVYNKDLLTDYSGPRILDICDPDWLGGGVDIAKFMNMASAITTSSESLRDVLKGYTHKPVVHIPDRINYSFLPKPKAQNDERGKTVVWYGYAQNFDTLGIVLDTLAEMKLNLLVVSNQPFEPMNNRGVAIKNVTWEPATAHQEIQRGDIVLNYQPPFGKFAYKSSNKTDIALALGLPVAKTAEDLERLLDPNERRKDVEAWNATRRAEMDIVNSAKQYKDLIVSLQ